MRVAADTLKAKASFLRNAVSAVGTGELSREQLPTQGLSKSDQATLRAAFDYLSKRGLVTPQKMDSLLNDATANALRTDQNRDGFVSSPEARALGSVSSRLVQAASDGFETKAATAGAQNINNTLNKLDVEHNRKYLPSGTRGTSSRVTHCNQFAQDALKGIGVPRANVPGGNANNMNSWLNKQGAGHGWRKVSGAEAQQMANSGHPVLASWKNTKGPHGHVAVVRPGHNDGKVHIAQAGGHNFNDAPVTKGFGKHAPEYFVYDGPVNGKTQAPVKPQSTAAAPSTAASPPVSGLHAAHLLGNTRQVTLGGGEAAIDLNGTRYTAIEGRAADNNISIQSKRRDFNPLTENGIALTTAQAKMLQAKVGDTVKVRDTKTGKTVTATYYDNAGTKPDGLKHFEVDPALADALGINYRNKNGKVVDAVTNGGQVDGRFVIEKN